MRVATFLLATLLGASSAAGQTLERTPVEAQLGDGEVLPGARLLLPVPLVRADPNSETIHVEVHHFPATAGASPGTPPIVVLNGGPGWQGLGPSLRNPRQNREQLLSLAQIADVIVVGQRGIGSSPPNTACDAPAQVAADVSEEARTEMLLAALRACRAKWEAEGLDLRGFNIIEAAGDVADAARALGFEQIQVMGGSFGSHWGMAVLRYHPELVARAVLMGLEGPDHTYDDPAGVLRVLHAIAAEAEADPAFADRVPAGGIIAGLEALIRRLERAPMRVALPSSQDSITISADDLRDHILGVRGSTSSRNGMRSWPDDMLRILAGDVAPLAARVAMARGNTRGLPTASFFMLDCGSGISPERHARYTTDPATKIVGHRGAFYDTACPAWDADLGADFRAGFTTAIPALLVHGTWDTSTPLENARDLAPHFTNSKLVLVERGSHGAFGEALREDAAFREFAFGFLRTGSLVGAPARVVLPPVEFTH